MTLDGLIAIVVALVALQVMVIGYLLRERRANRSNANPNPHSDHDLLVRMDSTLDTINERLAIDTSDHDLLMKIESSLDTMNERLGTIDQRQDAIWKELVRR